MSIYKNLNIEYQLYCLEIFQPHDRMKAELIAHDGEELTIQIKVKITGSLFEAEHTILDACNEVGQLATLHVMNRFDTDGSPIQVGGVKFTSKGTTPKFYETPYGAVARISTASSAIHHESPLSSPVP
jgi:hypothetical protein